MLCGNGAVMGSDLGTSGPVHLRLAYADLEAPDLADEVTFWVDGRAVAHAYCSSPRDVLEWRSAAEPGPHFAFCELRQHDGSLSYTAPIWWER